MRLPEFQLSLEKLTRVSLVACGTSFYASQVGKYWIEQCARLPVENDIASEYRYRDPVMVENGMAIFVSQSGETADTLAALRAAKKAGQYCVAIVNMADSSMEREADLTLKTAAGPEIGVASTKAFTTQLAVLACLALALGKARGILSDDEVNERMQALLEIPAKIAFLLRETEPYQAVAHFLAQARDVLYMGRGTAYPLAWKAR